MAIYALRFAEGSLFMKISFSGRIYSSEYGNSIADSGIKAKRKKTWAGLGLLMGCLLLNCGCSGQKPESTRHSLSMTAMGTVVSMTLYGEKGQEKELSELGGELSELVTGLETEMLSRKLEGSQVWEINSGAGAGETAVSKEMWELLKECQEVAETSEGAFDGSLGTLTALWNMDERAAGNLETDEIPSEEEIKEARKHSGYQKVGLTEDSIFLETGMQLDLGAVGKGYALDRIRSRLQEPGRESISGVFSLGGSILTFGRKKEGSPWKVAIVNPADTEKTIGYLELEGTWCISTSGDYERYFFKDGVRYHHILDPETGWPADSGLRSVTIVSENGFLSDALSTACFVAGEEKGMELAEHYGVGVVMVDQEGKIICNPAAEKIFHGTGER